MRWNPNNGVRHTRGSYFWIFIFRMPSIHQSVGPHRRERRERCSTRWEGGEEDARRALVNPITLVSIIALSGGKSRKFLGISKLICSDLRADRQSGKSGGDPDARAHEIQREAKNPGGGEVPRTSETPERPFLGFFGLQKRPFLRSEACKSCKLKQKLLLL